MSYDYQLERRRLFTEDGVAALLKIRDAAEKAIALGGAVQSGSIMIGGDEWLSMAAMDFLVEREELQRVTPKGSTAGQHEIFVAGRRMPRR